MINGFCLPTQSCSYETITTKPDASPSGPLFLELPDETLLQILGEVIRDGRSAAEYTKAAYISERNARASRISKVSRRFFNLTTPLLYSELVIDGRLTTSWSKAAALHRSLQENPSLRALSRGLHVIDGDHFYENVRLYVVYDVIRWLTGVRSFSMDGEYKTQPARSWSLLQLAVATIPGLEALDLGNVDRNFLLRPLYRYLARLQNLKTLRLRGISRSPTQIPLQSPASVSYFSPPSIINVREPDKATVLASDWSATKGTASFRTLELSAWSSSWVDLQHLVLCAARLEHFTFENCSLDHRMYPQSDLTVLQGISDILSPHAATLKSIVLVPSLREKAGQSESKVDLRQFRVLERLDLPRGLIRSSTDCAHLLPPRLREFRWIFPIENWWEEFDSFLFSAQEEEWLRRLASTAVVEHGIPLRSVAVELAVDDIYMATVCRRHWREEDTVYPWDRFDNLARNLASLNVKVLPSPPHITRESFEKGLQSLRAWGRIVGHRRGPRGQLILVVHPSAGDLNEVAYCKETGKWESFM